MNLQITTYSSYLLACLPHVDEFHYKPELRYIHLCNGYIGASNLHTAIVIEDKYLEHCNYLVPVQAVRELEHILNECEENHDQEVKIIVHEGGIGSMWTDGSFEIKFEFGKFGTINFKHVCSAKPEPYSGVPPIFNPQLLNSFQQSQHYLYGSLELGVQVYPTGAETPAFIDIDSGIYGAIMPMAAKYVREGKTLGHTIKGRISVDPQNNISLE